MKPNFRNFEISKEPDLISVKNKNIDFTEAEIELFKMAQADWDAYIEGIRMRAYLQSLCPRCGETDVLGHRCVWPPKLISTCVT